METRTPYVSLGLVAVATLLAVTLLAWGTSSAPTVQATDANIPETISLGASGSGVSCGSSGCSVTNPTGSFTLTVDADVAPDDGYSGIASEVLLGGLTYSERDACSDELVWPDQSFCTRVTGAADQPRHGGATGIIPPFEKSNYIGTLVELDVACPGEGEHEVLLTALPFALFGAAYVDLGGVPVFVKTVEERNLDLDSDGLLDARQEDTDGDTVPDADVLDPETGERVLLEYGIADTLTITCGGEPPGEPGDGDANGDGSTNSIDAAFVLQADAGLISGVPNPDGADVNQDGNLNSLDALLILQFDAGLISSLPI